MQICSLFVGSKNAENRNYFNYVNWPDRNLIRLHSTHSDALGWVEMRQLNFAVNGPKLPNFDLSFARVKM